jgi:hypothetical protein
MSPFPERWRSGSMIFRVILLRRGPDPRSSRGRGSSASASISRQAIFPIIARGSRDVGVSACRDQAAAIRLDTQASWAWPGQRWGFAALPAVGVFEAMDGPSSKPP